MLKSSRVNFRVTSERFLKKVQHVLQKIRFVLRIALLNRVDYPVRGTSSKHFPACSSQLMVQMPAGLTAAGQLTIHLTFVHGMVV